MTHSSEPAADTDTTPDGTDTTGDISAAPVEPAGPPAGQRRPRRVVALLAAGLVAVLVAGGLIGARIVGVWGPSATAAVEVPPPSPTEPPSPFDGTPAADFAEGADGIVLPEAEAVGDFTAEEVADALELVREALIAARLDHTMLVDHNPDNFLSLFALDDLEIRDLVESSESSVFATQIAADNSLAAVSPRVDGSVSYATVSVGLEDVIEVTTQFVWAYPVIVSDGDSVQLSIIRDELVWWVASEPRRDESQGLWLITFLSAAGVWGADCDSFESGILLTSEESSGDLSGQWDAIIDWERSPDSVSTC